MINELYSLSIAMEQSGIQAQSWHRKYKPIPNIRVKAPCASIVISAVKVISLSTVKPELGVRLRKFGTNQGSFPCMNLAPLYRITDDAVKKELDKILPEDLTQDKLEDIKGGCRESNWGSKFRSKYKISMENAPNELAVLVLKYTPVQLLINESKCFLNPEHLHQELQAVIFRMLNDGVNIPLALNVLFYFGKADKDAKDDYGSLSVAFESTALIDMGTPAISEKFTQGLNEALLQADSVGKDAESSAIDAFSIPFEPIEEPRPEVKLVGGCDVKLRTMFKEQRCQTRYARIENASYPISPQMRKCLQAALNRIGSTEHKDVTWINTDKNEILFAYPSQLPKAGISFTRMFKRPENRDETFEEQAKQFLSELKQSKKAGTDSRADRIQLFILRKIDKSRTKVVYTRQTDSFELERRSEVWTIGCSENLPVFSFGQPGVPFPLDTADILNLIWKQNGELVTDKFKPVPRYHGMELLMESDLPVTSGLHILSEKAMTIGASLGSKLANREKSHPIWAKIKNMLALMGLLLNREGIGKDTCMEKLPYLYGQLLKDDEDTEWTLVATYCVEAGVDFSFRTGFRELSSLLSLLQAAGRVNRHGSFQDAEMWSFSMQDDSMLKKNPSLETSCGVLKDYFDRSIDITPELSTRSMNEELVRDDSCMSAIKSLITDEKAMQFKTVDKRFKVIDANTILAVVDEALARSVSYGKGDWQQLQRKSVSIRFEEVRPWNLKEIAKGVYQWTLRYDSFLGYIRGILDAEKAKFEILII